MSTILFPGQYKPLGYSQLTTTLSSAVGLPTPPAGALYALIQAVVHNVIWTDDGTTTPTSTVGFVLIAGNDPSGFLASQFTNLKFIQSASGCLLNISFYG